MEELKEVEVEKPSPDPDPDPLLLPLPRSPLLSAVVTYCCGACGYDLKLSSSARVDDGGDVSGGGGARCVPRWRRRGVVAFSAIDDARFGHGDEFRCLDLRARRLFACRTRLLCRDCGAHLGFGYDDTTAAKRPPRYHIRIRALHPASSSSSAPPPPSPPTNDA